MIIHFQPRTFFTPLRIAIFNPSNGEEDYGEDCGVAARRKLFLSGVLSS